MRTTLDRAGRGDRGDRGPGRGADEPTPVLFANNYDMIRARAGWRAGCYPAHHLFGTPWLGSEFEVIDLPFTARARLARVTQLTRRKLGDIGQELAAAWRRPRGVVLGAVAPDVRGLAWLRAAHLFGMPIVGVFHHWFGGHALRGFDHAIALSRYTREGLVDAGMPAERITVLGWGPDLEFPGFAPGEPAAADAPVVATGKTGRDLPTLLEALGSSGLPARIYGDRDELAKTVPIPAGVTIRPVAAKETSPSTPLSYEHVLTDLRSAALVAIPLADLHPLFGLTEVVDALACARPMILTRAPYFDFDIEEIGCGWWVERGDVRGWSERLTAAMGDRERLERMGRAGRAWAQEHLNARLFAAGVRRVLLEVSGRSAASPA